MNHHIKGILFEKYPGGAVIENGGIGYTLHISMNTYASLPEKENDVMLYTYLSIKNEEFNLYGFATLKERDLFFSLIQIPKVGPKTALAVFNAINPEQFEQAVETGDSAMIAKAKGISRKTADSIILQLSGKLSRSSAPVVNDAYNALTALGFSAKEIDTVLPKILEDAPDKNDTEFVVREALKRLR